MNKDLSINLKHNNKLLNKIREIKMEIFIKKPTNGGNPPILSNNSPLKNFMTKGKLK